MTFSPRLRATAVLAALTVGLLGLAAPTEAAPAAPTDRAIGPTTFTEAGPYLVGERTVKLKKSGIPIEIWYPARKRDAIGQPGGSYDVVDWLPSFLQALVPEGESVSYPSGGVRRVEVANKKFPLVVFSHGFAGFRTQSSFLTSALASWGFVVAAPEHPSRNVTKVLGGPAGPTTDVQDLRRTIALVKRRSATKGNWLKGHVDSSRIGAVGHSAGGRAVETLATVDKRVDTFVGMAGASTGALGEGAAVPEQPGMLITGADDAIVRLDRMEAAYDALTGPKRFVQLENSGHLVFSDLCEVGASDGGLLAIGALLGITIPDSLVPLATDGCLDPARPVTEVWPAVLQAVTAYLRHELGVDSSTAGLDGLVEAFPGIVSENRSVD
ncbi:MAG: dienelactone hydrolase family protein [Nocardioides sp.]